jgi:hypothetical protein
MVEEKSIFDISGYNTFTTGPVTLMTFGVKKNYISSFILPKTTKTNQSKSIKKCISEQTHCIIIE